MISELTAEPRELDAIVLAGEHPDEVVYARHDAQEPEDPRRWWPLTGAQAEPVTWGEVVHVQVAGPDGAGWRARPVVRLYRQADVDTAVRAAQVVPLGTHLMEPGGYCRTCGIVHAHTEWARIHDQLMGEVDRG